jgi:hypothetical protein
MKYLLFCIGLLLSISLPATLFAKGSAIADPALNHFSTTSFIYAQLPDEHFSFDGYLAELEDDDITSTEKKDLFEADRTLPILTAYTPFVYTPEQNWPVQQAAQLTVPIFILIKVFRL